MYIVQGVQPPKPMSLTVPQSPAFALKRTTRAAAAAAVSMNKELEQVWFLLLVCL